MGSSSAKYILFELKKHRGIIFHEAEEGSKFREESTRRFKIGIRNLTNFDLSPRKSQRFSHEWAPYEQKVYIVCAKKVQRSNLS